MIRATTFNGKRVAVFGLGGSGLATARALVDGGASVVCWDDGVAARQAAQEQGFAVADLATADWSGFAALLLAPGVPLTHPEPHWTVKLARTAGVEVIGDIEVFFRERAAHCPQAPVICITGTNGKSTTTALVAHILQTAGRDVEMGGNIGKAVLTLAPPSMDRIHVIEISTFQIDLTPSLKPTIGVLLNLTPDHLDRHGPADDLGLAMKNYAAIKERIVASADAAIIAVEDAWCQAIADRIGSRGAPPLYQVATDRRPGLALFAENGRIISDRDGAQRVIASIDNIATLRGRHNAQNAGVASAVAMLVDVSAGALQDGLRSYPGLPHRMEEVGRAGRVLFINDSKATNADSTEKALAAFSSDIYWILGGKPKEGGITTLAPYFPRIARAYLIGAASEEFARTLNGKVAFEHCKTLDIAVTVAARDAAAATGAEPVVLLSPACASYDQFKNFEVRGDTFVRLVAALPGISMRGRTI